MRVKAQRKDHPSINAPLNLLFSLDASRITKSRISEGTGYESDT